MKSSDRIVTWQDVKELGSQPQPPSSPSSDRSQPKHNLDSSPLPVRPNGWSRVITPSDNATSGD